jgi:4-alpha-glucanotransferase
MTASATSLRMVADAAGVMVDWVDVASQPQQVDEPTLRAVLDALDLPTATARQAADSLKRLQAHAGQPLPLRTGVIGQPIDAGGTAGESYQLLDEQGVVHDGNFDAQGRTTAVLEPGYYTLQHGRVHTTLAVGPPCCYSPAEAFGDDAARRWGLALQAYSARGPYDASIGDAGGASLWVQRLAAAGADALALSPLHAGRQPGPHHSPYSPSDRRFLEPLHASPARVLGHDEARAALEDAGLGARFAALEAQPLVDWVEGAAAKWAWLQQLHRRFATAPEALREDFASFCIVGGDELQRYAQAAADDFADGESSADLQRFAQWLSVRSWSSLQQEARQAGMEIGLIADLAVGFDPAGAEAAAWPDATLRGLELGAPPDAFNAQGQCWGITGYSPLGLQRSGFAPFISLLRAVMRDRGGVRIDHILGLLRLWVIPAGGDRGSGAYLRYPLIDLLRLLALESWRHRCIVIGEDLGVVPEGFRETLSHHGVLGIDVLLFARDAHGRFLAPGEWRRDAIATTTTHDLPTLAGWRSGNDIAWRQRLGLSDADQLRQDIARRESDIAALDRQVSLAVGSNPSGVRGALRSLTLLPAEDALALEEQPNFPGTVAGHPNWRRRLPVPLPEPLLSQNLAAFADARSRL